MLQHFGLTGRILFSFWLTLVLVVLATVLIFITQKDDDHAMHSIPPIKTSETLTLKLLSTDYALVAEWFAQQDPRDTRRIYIVNDGEEILERKLPRGLNRINSKLSPTHPFIHRNRKGFIMVGRYLLLPDGHNVNVLIRSHDHKPPMHNIIAEQWLGFVVSAILISGLISYLLALYIVKPIILLRNATQKLASGDLSIRVQDDMKGRHGEVSLLAHDFDHMADRLEKTISSHKHLIQDISHELRSPVARLQLALELCKKRLNISDDQIDIARIEKECEQINAIINTLLNLPAYELDPSLAFQDNVSITRLLSHICDDLNFSHPNNQIALSTDIQQDINLVANQQLLRSAIENVLKNAQYYHQGNEPIKVDITQEQTNIVIRCCDQGPGVSHQQLEEIFKPFYRISEARERSSGGHGLGLAISKRAIELHSGHIIAQAHSPQGLCVIITLPYEASS
ncbi:ATP-binding protein [Pseudomonas sp. HK3]|jgi:two-component system sensor histidine kinase CpxA